MKRILLSIFVSLVIGIASHEALMATQAEQGKPVSVTPVGQRVPGHRTPFMGGGGMWDQLRLVVRDREMWTEVWKRVHALDPTHPNPQAPPLPEIDFSREMVIVAAMGQRPSSGYAIYIDGAYSYERNYRLEVIVRSVENRKGCPEYQVMTAPVDIVRLPRTDRTVIFRETEEAPDCK